MSLIDLDQGFLIAIYYILSKLKLSFSNMRFLE